MKRLLFIFLLICPLWVYTSCGDGWNWGWNDDDEDEEIVTGTNPEILIGKWERYVTASFIFEIWEYYQRYEIRKDGGLIIQQPYDKATQTYSEPDTSYRFSNWLYSEEKQLIYFNINKSKTRYNRARSLEDITPNSIKIGGSEYHKIEE